MKAEDAGGGGVEEEQVSGRGDYYFADDRGFCAGNPCGEILGEAVGAIQRSDVDGGMCCADGKNKFIVHGDSGELRVCDIRRD